MSILQKILLMKTAIHASGHPLVLPAALAGSILLASLGISIATVALPTLATAHSVSMSHVQWVVLAYLLALTVFIVPAGRLGDLFGRRRVLMAGLTLFGLASLLSATSASLGWLIAGRVGQGLGAAVLMSLPLSLVKDLVADERLGAAMGVLGTMSAIGTALGPSLGGVLIHLLGWRSVFFLLLLCAVGMLLITMRVIPGTSRLTARVARVDWAGCLWLGLSLLFGMLAATGGKAGAAIPVWLLLCAAAPSLGVFVAVERSAAPALVPLTVLQDRALAAALGMHLMVSAIMMSTLVLGPFFLTRSLGLSELSSGMVMALGTACRGFVGRSCRPDH